ncbi:hypothetical protein B0H13DRAFT_839120 [Mycena leptocephala]|nr:hypothetical protein B0H13DRAFT_839120 [Mycena leptocephala]
MCTMDEEEGVLGLHGGAGIDHFGIHTQSCLMSSVDLHTYASFQRMPLYCSLLCVHSNRNQGLQTVLQYTKKQAFHRHPDLPIYTDADRTDAALICGSRRTSVMLS